MSARSRRALANLEERIQKLINTVFFWLVEAGKILMHFLIVNMNKLDLIRCLPYPRNFFLSIIPVRCGRIETDVIDSFFLGRVKTRRCANQFAYTILFYSLKREGF